MSTQKFYFSKRSEAFLNEVNPKLKNIAKEALKITRIDFAIISGKRTIKEQKELVKKGKSKTLNSRHLSGNAIDIAPIDPITGKGKFDRVLALEIATAFYQAAQNQNIKIEWGGTWKNFEDIPHFELVDE